MDPQTIIAKRVAQELRPGNLVNLGIGNPTLVAKYVPAGLNVFFQSENGLIGTGPIPEQGMAHPCSPMPAADQSARCRAPRRSTVQCRLHSSAGAMLMSPCLAGCKSTPSTVTSTWPPQIVQTTLHCANVEAPGSALIGRPPGIGEQRMCHAHCSGSVRFLSVRSPIERIR